MTYNPRGRTPQSEPRDRIRRSPAFTLVLALVGAELLLAGCGGNDSPPEPPLVETATDSSATAAPVDPPQSDSAELPESTSVTPPSDGSVSGGAEGEGSSISASTPLTSDGWGPLRIGMTRAEVVAAAGEDANPDAVGGPDPASCDEFRPLRAPGGLLVMIENGRLTRISLGSGSAVESDRGIGVGDPAAEVRRVYGDRARSTPHKYVAAPAEYLTVWTVEPPAANARGLVYEVGLDGRISRIHGGSASIQYVEGCL